MPVIHIKTDQGSLITSGTGVPIHGATAGDRYTDTATGNTYQYTNTWKPVAYGQIFSHFVDSQNTTAPNATVPVNIISAVAGATNADVVILPKGTGAFIVGHIPDGSIDNGPKRGAGAIELLTDTMYYWRGSEGANSVSIGSRCSATAQYAVAIGRGAQASGVGAVSLGNGNAVYATGPGSFAVGAAAQNSNASGNASVALNGGQASGESSFAVAYGTASGAGSVALGGGYVAGPQATAFNSFATNNSTLADGTCSSAFGRYSSTKGVGSRITLGSFQDAGPYLRGSSQLSFTSKTIISTGVTGIEFQSYDANPIALPMQDNEAIRVRGSIIGKQTGATGVACYDFDSVIVRGVGASTTDLLISNLNTIVDTIGITTLPVLSANTGSGGLSIKCGGKLSTTIRWSARIDSTEAILA
jgi:hypothetical protein